MPGVSKQAAPNEQADAAPRARMRLVQLTLLTVGVTLGLLGAFVLLQFVVVMQRPAAQTPGGASASTVDVGTPAIGLQVTMLPVATLSSSAQWCAVFDPGRVSRAAQQGATPTPEALAGEGLVMEARKGKTDTWYVLLRCDGASTVDCGEARPGEVVAGARVDPGGKPYVSIELPPALAHRFGELTAAPGFRLAVVLDGKVMTAPTVMSRLGGSLQLVEIPTKADAGWIAARIREHPGALRLQRAVAPGELADEDSLRREFHNTGETPSP